MKNNIDKEISEKIFAVYRKMKQGFNSLKKINITMIQLHALIFIKENKNCQLTDLAKSFSITLPTANSLIEKLVNLKLVSRKNDKDDRRIIHLFLTDKGIKTLKKIENERVNCFSSVISKLNNEEKKQLLKILEKITS
ncbi:MAG: MarR family winged helix-turn-helix transcriptional regulator [Microgenomates group bacterium]